MITNYLPYIFGTTSLLIGLLFLLYSFKIYKPKYRSEVYKIKSEKAIEKYSVWMKICALFLIINGAYDLINPEPNRYRIGKQQEQSVWGNEDKEVMIKDCILSTDSMAIKFPEITKEYCECSTDKVMKAMSKGDYMKNAKKSSADQMLRLMPVIQDCLMDFKNKIAQSSKQKK